MLLLASSGNFMTRKSSRRGDVHRSELPAHWNPYEHIASITRETRACREVFVYFKHEEQGKGPELAAMLRVALANSGGDRGDGKGQS